MCFITLESGIKRFETNLNHWKAENKSLLKYIEENKIDLVLFQNPHMSKICFTGISIIIYCHYFKTYASEINTLNKNFCYDQSLHIMIVFI